MHDPSPQFAVRLRAPEALIADQAWLRNLTRRLTGDLDAAADLEQDVALATLAAERRDGGAGTDRRANRSWLATVACNLAALARRRAHRDEQRRRHLPALEHAPSPAELVATAELQRRAVDAVLALPDVYRDTILARFLQGFSVEQTARHLGVPVETVRTRQQRALRQLRAQLLPDRSRGLLNLLLPIAIADMNKKVLFAAALPLVLALLSIPLVWNGATAAPPPVGEPPIVAVAPTPDVVPGTAAPQPAPVERESLASAPSAPPTPPPPPATGSIDVVVTFADGQPAGERGVWCRSPSGGVRHRVADGLGRVQFDRLQPGDHTVGVSDRIRSKATVQADAPTRVELRIAKGLTIRGRVVGPADQPVPFAELFAKSASVSPSYLHTLGRTDGNGHFEVSGLEHLEMVGARDPRLGASLCEILRQGNLDREIVLRLDGVAPTTLRGRVTTAAGAPIADAWVEVAQPRMAKQGDDGVTRQPLPSSTTHSDLGGEFEVAWLRPGPAVLRVYRRGFAPHTRDLDPGDPTPAVVRLAPGATFVGTVLDAAGKPPIGATIHCDQLKPPQAVFHFLGKGGSFEFTDLPPGRLTFSVNAKGVSRLKHTLQVRGTETQQWDGVLTDERLLRGRLFDHQGAPLAAWKIDRPNSLRFATTDTDGRFALPDCDGETVTLRVRQRVGHGPVVMQFENVANRGDDAMLMVPADRASVLRATGRCVALDGTPLAGVTLQLSQYDQGVGPPVRTPADGTFEFGSMPPGDYRLEARHPSWRFDPVTFTLVAGSPGDLGVLRGLAPDSGR